MPDYDFITTYTGVHFFPTRCSATRFLRNSDRIIEKK